VLPVSARLSGIGDGDVFVFAIRTWPGCFDVVIGGDGSGPELRAGLRSWTAEDDRGQRYEGRESGGSSGATWAEEAVLFPALDPQATHLALTFPHPFDETQEVRAELTL
jgi:hypothetical protein